MTLLRSSLFNAWFILSTLVLGLFGLIVRFMPPWRALWLARIWAQAVLGGARLICGIRFEVIGRENLPQGAALIASQHQSAFDTFVWLLIVPQPAYVYKAELRKVPLVGHLMERSGQIKLDRGASMPAIRSLFRATDQAVADARQIVIFPEGTRVDPGVTADILPGFAALAARTGLPIIPVSTDSGRLWGRQAFIKRPGLIQIVIGSPIPPRLGQKPTLAALRAAWSEGAATMSACG